MIRTDLYGNPWVGIVSAHRPNNVPKMGALIGNATWYVPKDQAPHYRRFGAEFVVESGGLCESRNAILDDAFVAGRSCIQLSDDLSRVKRAVHADGKSKGVDISFHDAVKELTEVMEGAGAKLAGCAPTSNAFFFSPERPVGTKHFIVGDFILVAPTPERFDEDMTLKEDYDFTLQHLTAYGLVARANALLPVFAHRTNKGGACAVRTSALEQENIAYLKNKWPNYIKDNPRRLDEILLRWKPPALTD